jgi:hypothetical protein
MHPAQSVAPAEFNQTNKSLCCGSQVDGVLGAANQSVPTITTLQAVATDVINVPVLASITQACGQARVVQWAGEHARPGGPGCQQRG